MALPVLIIGTGLGGLNLAHCLEKHRIPHRLFERDGEREQRAQGYRISLDGGGSGGGDGLKAALAPELFGEFEKSCGESHPPGGRVDGPSGRLLQAGVLGLLGTGGWPLVSALGSRYLFKRWERRSWASWSSWLRSWVVRPAVTRPIIAPGQDKSYPTDRRVLRSILLTSQSPHITYDSTFTHYTLAPDSVTAHFSNGASIKGSLLVGADGVRSRVAAQLLGPAAAAPRELGFRVVYGKTPLTPEVEAKLLPILRKGPSFVTDTTAVGQRITLVLEAMRFHHPRAPADYIFWALCAVTEAFASTESSAPLELDHILRHLTGHWDPQIRVIIDQRTPDETASLGLTSSNPDRSSVWETERRVTVLGDAVHCMPPTGGQGGNSALYDAALLGAALAESGEAGGDQGWSKETIRRYEDAMRYNIGDIVGMACIGVDKAFGSAVLG